MMTDTTTHPPTTNDEEGGMNDRIVERRERAMQEDFAWGSGVMDDTCEGRNQQTCETAWSTMMSSGVEQC